MISISKIIFNLFFLVYGNVITVTAKSIYLFLIISLIVLAWGKKKTSFLACSILSLLTRGRSFDS